MLLDTQVLLWFLQDSPRLHRDPFDRMLVAVSQVDRIALVSADPQVLSCQTVVVDAR